MATAESAPRGDSLIVALRRSDRAGCAYRLIPLALREIARSGNKRRIASQDRGTHAQDLRNGRYRTAGLISTYVQTLANLLAGFHVYLRETDIRRKR